MIVTSGSSKSQTWRISSEPDDLCLVAQNPSRLQYFWYYANHNDGKVAGFDPSALLSVYTTWSWDVDAT
jgi:hypothetical protein